VERSAAVPLPPCPQLLQFSLQLAAFSRENHLKYAVFCAKRGKTLASYTETSSAVAARAR
jgi:hypothetical protein